MRTGRGLLLGAVVLAISACATAPPPPVANVSGHWAGTWWAFEGAGGSGELRGTLLQEGARVNGQITVIGRETRETFISGVMSGNEIALDTPNQGTLVLSGDELSGVISGIAPFKVAMRRQP